MKFTILLSVNDLELLLQEVDNGNYYISGGFGDEQGIVANSRVKSGDLRINLNQDLNKNLKLQARATAFLLKQILQSQAI